MRKAIAIWSPIAAALVFCLAASGERTSAVLAPGVRFEQESLPGPVFVNVLRIDLKQPGVRVETAKSKDYVFTESAPSGRETVAAIARRKGAVAAINADFFPFTGDPLGLAIRSGELLSESMPNRAALGITSDGRVLFDNLLSVGTIFGSDNEPGALDGINRPIGNNDIVLLTPAFGGRTATSANATMVVLNDLELPFNVNSEHAATPVSPSMADPKLPIPIGGGVLIGSGTGADWLKAHIKDGERIRLRFDLTPTPPQEGPARGRLAARAGSYRGRITRSIWSDVKQAVGGGPWLVRDGKVAVDGEEEGFPAEDFVNKRHPRTAAGVAADGELILVAVDGRQPHSRGMSLPELADYMLKLGAVNAINLDGGGSTQMAVDGFYANVPSDFPPRPVADALIVLSDGYALPNAAPDNPRPLTFSAGSSTGIPLNVAGALGQSPLFGTLEGDAFVDSTGTIHSTHAGPGVAVARVGAGLFAFPFKVLPGPAAKIRIGFSAAPNNPPDRDVMNVVITDAFGNPVENQRIGIKAAGGTPDASAVTTDSRGRVSVEIVWDAAAGRSVTVSCLNLTATALAPKH